jgi:hypothetical protein
VLGSPAGGESELTALPAEEPQNGVDQFFHAFYAMTELRENWR